MKTADNTCAEFPNMTRVLDEELYSIRKQKKLSQLEIAYLAGRSRNCIQQMECHEHLPNIDSIFRYAYALEFDQNEFCRFMARLWSAYHRDIRLQRKKEGWEDA